jgi:hypothetical protein
LIPVDVYASGAGGGWSYSGVNFSTHKFWFLRNSVQSWKGLFTTDGRTLSGFLADQDNAAIVLRGLDGQNVSLARKDIREIRALPTSLMPDGLLQGLSDREVRDFFAYLRIPQPITR